MAVHAPITGAPSRASTIRHPASLPPMPAVQRILLRYARNDRETLEAFLSVAIDLLDLIDGDPDLEDSETGSATVNACGREIVHDWHFLQTEDDEEDCPREDDDPREEGF